MILSHLKLNQIKWLMVMLLGVFMFDFSAGQTFSNTTVANYNTWDSGNTWTNFTRTITVSGLPTPLGTSAGQVVLKQINIQLGKASGSTKADLSTYNFRLTSPTGQILYIVSTNLTTEITPMWVNLHYRDDASMERIRDYPAGVQSGYFPFGIGFYRVETAGSFNSTFNGFNPNGTWTFAIKESGTSEISFERVDIIFAPYKAPKNATLSTANDNCSGAVCFDGTSGVVGTNNGYVNNDPLYPGNIVNGCDWNGGNNNSAWFEFKPSGTTASLTISGILSPGNGTNEIQPIILQAPNNNCASAPSIVPPGGCPNDTSKNNKSYHTNYGGGTTLGNAYNNGITANTEFNLSGLIAGQKYYLYIDGNQGATSSFYIDVISGVSPCPDPLPVEWVSFVAKCRGNYNELAWTLGSEINTQNFIVERSTDGYNYDMVGTITAAGTANLPTHYSFNDYNLPYGTDLAFYYRIRQIDINGDYSFSSIASCSFNDLATFDVFPTPIENVMFFNPGDYKGLILNCYDITGRIIRSDELENRNNVDYSSLATGPYIIKVEDATGNQLKTLKILKK